MTTTFQFRRGSTANSNALIGAEGEMFVDLERKTIVIHDGVTQGGYPVISDTNAVKEVSANTIYNAEVNLTQNTNISYATALAQGAYDAANAAGSSNYVQSAFNTANSASANTIYNSGVDVTQNNWISSNAAFTQAAFNQANTTAGGLLTANSNISIIQGVNLTQNTNIQIAYNLANQANTLANLAYTLANSATQGGVSTSGYLNNSIIFANTLGYLSNTSNLQYFDSNTTLKVANVFISNSITFYDGSIQTSFANTSNLYSTQISDAVTSIAVGGAPSQPASTWKKYTLIQALDTILFPTLGPSYTVPTISLTANNTGTFEIGQPINQLLTVTATKNDAGVFTQLRINRNAINISTNNSPSNTVTTSITAQYGYNDPNNPNYVYTAAYVDANTIVSGSTTWTGYGNYNQGQAKLNNKGVTDSNAFAVLLTTNPQAANAASFASSSQTVTGIYPYFYGISATQPTASTIASAIAAGTANKVLAVGSGTLTITFGASTPQYLWLAVQTGYAAKTTWYNTALNNGSIGAGQLFLSPVSQAVTSPQSYWSGVTYNIYISGYATTTTTLSPATIQFS